MAPRVLPVATALASLFVRAPTALACDPSAARTQVQTAWSALDELRADDFFTSADGIAACPDLSPQERAEILRLQGASAALQKDTERAVRLFGEARAIDPDGQLPERAFPPTHPVARLYRLAALAPQAIVRLQSLIQTEHGPALILVYVPGFTLHQILRVHDRLPVAPALELLAEVADALEAGWSQVGPLGQALRLLQPTGRPPASSLGT